MSQYQLKLTPEYLQPGSLFIDPFDFYAQYLHLTKINGMHRIFTRFFDGPLEYYGVLICTKCVHFRADEWCALNIREFSLSQAN